MVLRSLERVNDYDYNCMLHEFKANETAEQKYRKKVNSSFNSHQHIEFMKQNKKWKENVENMNKKKENVLTQKRKSIIKNMIKKNETV